MRYFIYMLNTKKICCFGLMEIQGNISSLQRLLKIIIQRVILFTILAIAGLTLDILKLASWAHMGCTANIIIKDTINILASISKIMRIWLMGRRNREHCIVDLYFVFKEFSLQHWLEQYNAYYYVGITSDLFFYARIARRTEAICWFHLVLRPRL